MNWNSSCTTASSAWAGIHSSKSHTHIKSDYHTDNYLRSITHTDFISFLVVARLGDWIYYIVDSIRIEFLLLDATHTYTISDVLQVMSLCLAWFSTSRGRQYLCVCKIFSFKNGCSIILNDIADVIAIDLDLPIFSLKHGTWWSFRLSVAILCGRFESVWWVKSGFSTLFGWFWYRMTTLKNNPIMIYCSWKQISFESQVLYLSKWVAII